MIKKHKIMILLIFFACCSDPPEKKNVEKDAIITLEDVVGKAAEVSGEIKEVKIYYLSCAIMTYIPVTEEGLKADGESIQKHHITDRATLFELKEKIDHLEEIQNKSKSYDVRLLCEIYYDKGAERLAINCFEKIRYKGKYYRGGAEILEVLKINLDDAPLAPAFLNEDKELQKIIKNAQ